MKLREWTGWALFMEELSAMGEQPHFLSVFAFMSGLVDEFPELKLPIVYLLDDGPIRLSWTKQFQYLEIDILPDGSFDWFWRDRWLGEVDGTQDPITEVPDTLMERVKAVAL